MLLQINFPGCPHIDKPLKDVHRRFRDQQAIIWPGRTSVDSNKINKLQLPVLLNFVSFQKAFNSVDRE